MAEWFPLPIELQMPHGGHEGHLCVAHNVGYIRSNLEGYKKLVRDGKFVCKQCGRVAASEKSVCEPDPL
ncbi:MAG: hypothetical protein GTN81_14985 [Proteobacteria bacterium]|nr:hypothetical protein [Pseudomonadota bacterium]